VRRLSLRKVEHSSINLKTHGQRLKAPFNLFKYGSGLRKLLPSFIYSGPSAKDRMSGIMHSALQAFFFVQVALEGAADKVVNLGQSIMCEFVIAPVQRSFSRFIGTIEKEDVQNLRSEIDSIRSEIQALRQDIRELQRSSTV
jgi:hypothetical protein